MTTPPPLPLPVMECIRFEGSGVGLHTAGFDRKRLDAAQAAAREWLASHPSVDVISIESSFGNLLAFVTVWYRRKHQ
jgi:hypothetical protein